MYLPIDKINLSATGGGSTWATKMNEAVARAAAKLGIGEQEVTESLRYTALVDASGTLHIRMAAPGGESVEADVPFTEWEVQGGFIQ